jgi:hypothetical protein
MNKPHNSATKRSYAEDSAQASEKGSESAAVVWRELFLRPQNGCRPDPLSGGGVTIDKAAKSRMAAFQKQHTQWIMAQSGAN